MINNKNIGPRIEPCGTPNFMYVNAETLSVDDCLLPITKM